MTLRAWGLLTCLALVALSGCAVGPQVGLIQSVFAIRTAVGAGNLDLTPPTACVWVYGRGGPAQGFTMVLGHGVPLDDCILFGPP